MADGGESPKPVKLGDATLDDLPASIVRPTYDRSKLTPGIVHIGLGNFHRAHQAWYLHRLMERGLAHDWAIIGAGVRPADAAQRERLLAQDCLTTLIELDPEGVSAEVVGSMIDFVEVAEGNGPLIARMSDPAIRIVSLTVTEGGYFVDPATGGFDAAHPDIVHDAAAPGAPRTAFGAMIAALRARLDAGHAAFTAQSCDNLQGNGDVLRQTVVSLARLSDPDLADWIDAECGFPNAMVDCIVPATGPGERRLAQTLGVDDAAPVTHENFRQWALEDDFRAGRPPWEAAGVEIADQVHVFETMKIRMLNGGHQIIAAAGDLLGLETIAGTMAHPLIAAMFRKVEALEIAPHVAPAPGMTPDAYLDLIERRFSNPEIRDTTRRVAFDGSSRQPGFIVPTIVEGLAAGAPVEGLALVTAIWARYCAGRREDGSVIEPNDPHWDDLRETARAARADPKHWLGMRRIYGGLGDDPRFAEPFARWLGLVHAEGVEAAIARYLAA